MPSPLRSLDTYPPATLAPELWARTQEHQARQDAAFADWEAAARPSGLWEWLLHAVDVFPPTKQARRRWNNRQEAAMIRWYEC